MFISQTKQNNWENKSNIIQSTKYSHQQKEYQTIEELNLGLISFHHLVWHIFLLFIHYLFDDEVHLCHFGDVIHNTFGHHMIIYNRYFLVEYMLQLVFQDKSFSMFAKLSTVYFCNQSEIPRKTMFSISFSQPRLSIYVPKKAFVKTYNLHKNCSRAKLNLPGKAGLFRL